MTQDRAALEAEARYLHWALFGWDLAPEVADRYARANEQCLADLSERSVRIARLVVERRLDPEAVELALRLGKRDPVLTQKIQILFYLIEVRSKYYPYFVNETPGLARGVAHLVAAVLATGWKLVKGAILVWRYGLA